MRVLLDCLLDNPSIELWGILDREQSSWETSFLGVRVVGGDEWLPRVRQQGVTHFIVGVGAARDNEPRARLYRSALAEGLLPLAGHSSLGRDL